MSVGIGFWQRDGTLAGIVIGVATTVIVGLAIAYWQRRPKFLSWMVFADEPLLPTYKRTPGLAINVYGTELSDPRVVLLTIYNHGREAIRREDFDQPITLSVPDAMVVSASLTTGADIGGQVDVSHDGHAVVVQPLLLNPSDRLSLHLIVDGPTSELNLTARIAGQTAGVQRLTLRPPRKGMKSMFADLQPVFRFPLVVGLSGLLAFAVAGIVVQLFRILEHLFR